MRTIRSPLSDLLAWVGTALLRGGTCGAVLLQLGRGSPQLRCLGSNRGENWGLAFAQTARPADLLFLDSVKEVVTTLTSRPAMNGSLRATL